MDPAPSLPTHGQPQGFFPNAQGFSFFGGVFTDIHYNTVESVIDVLKPHISEAALHDSSARYPPPQCYTRIPSRQKVLKVITDWIEEPHPDQRIMWLNGPARAGKSPMAQTIAERYQDSRLAASFFFLRNSPDRGVANRLFTTLAWQLAKSIPETRPCIESALQKEPLLLTKSIDIQFNYLVVKVFESLLRDNPGLQPEKYLVIIDGLDECVTEQDQKLFLTLIAKPEAHIKETFDTFDMEIMKTVTCAVVLGPVLDDLKSHFSEAAIHDSDRSARSPLPLCYPNTSKIITNWINDSYTRQRIMWLIGPAGAGKSAMAHIIAEHYKNSRLAASFFYLRNSPDRGVADHLFTTLAWQLAKSTPETRPRIESALQKEPLLLTKSINVQFDYLVVQVFESLLRDNPGLLPEKYLVIIDGVDECATEQDQKHFLTLIADALTRTSIPLRFLICSRPEAHIKETFDMEIMQNITRAVVLDENLALSDVVWRYLENELSRIFSTRNIRRPSFTDIDCLVSKASGQPIYASTVIKFIDDNDCNPREQLDIILKLPSVNSSSPYAQLDQLYIQILSQQPDIKFLTDIFVLVIGLAQSKTGHIKFICRRLRISQVELRRKLRKILPLLQISDSTITTSHGSLHDFFRDKNRAGIYHIDPIRVSLVRFQERPRPIAKRLGIVLLVVLMSPLLPLLACT